MTDLPFGRRHKTEMGIPRLYELALGEITRVLKPASGRAVLFTTKRALLSKLVLADARWLLIARHEVVFGSLKA